VGRFSLTRFLPLTRISAAASRVYFQYLIIALLCATFTVGAVAAFPEFDDGYLMLILKERGVSAILSAHPDRPLVGWMWQVLATVFGSHFWAFGFLSHLVLWSVLGIQASLLWNRMFPELIRYGGVVGCLTVAPIVVQVQLSTVTITLLGLLSAVLGYGAILLIFTFIGKASRSAFVLGLMLLTGGILVSEYAVPVTAVALILFLRLYLYDDNRETKARALKASIAVLGVASLACVAFLIVQRTKARVEVSPEFPLHNPRLILSYPLALVTQLWRVTFGVYGRTMSNITLSWGEKSSIIAIAYGLVIAVLLVLCSWEHPSELKSRLRELFFLLLVLVVGLTPIALMRPYFSAPFDTRYHIPVLPIAAMVTAWVSLTVVRARARIAVVGLLGMFIGMAVFTESWAAYGRQKLMRSLGETLKPYVASSDGVTVAVLSSTQFCDSGIFCTAKATDNWPAELSRRFWLLTTEHASEEIGDRTSHSPVSEIHETVRVGTTILRDGQIKKTLWIEMRDGEVSIEPYYFRDAPMLADPGVAQTLTVLQPSGRK
jgi:hypothetical protein